MKIMKKNLFILFAFLGVLSCEKTQEKETPATYKPNLSNPEKPIIIVPNDSSFFGQISFNEKDRIHIILPDSTEIIAQQTSPTTRKYYLAIDTFLVFSTKNYQNGFLILSNENKALWQITLKDTSVEVQQKGMNQNKFEILLKKNTLLLKQENKEVSKVVLEQEKAIFYKKDKQVFAIKTDKLLYAFGILLIDEMSIEEKYAIFAETVARGY